MENITKTGKTFHEKKKKNQENPKLKGSKGRISGHAVWK